MKKKYKECLAKEAGTGDCGEKRIGRFCSKHRGQYRKGVIDKNGNKLRDLRISFKGKECIAKNAGTGSCSEKINGRFCIKHGNQYRKGIIDKNGNKLRELIKGTRKKYTECIAKNSGTGNCGTIRKGRLCRKHYSQYRKGIIDKEGNKLRDLKSRYYPECLAKNSGTGICSIRIRNSKFCKKHHSQYSIGIIDKEGNKLRDPHKKYTECIAKNAGTGKCAMYTVGKFCWKHRAQYYLGIIDKKGNKLREVGYGLYHKYKECVAKGKHGVGHCGGSFLSRFCARHTMQYKRGIIDKNGNKLRELIKGTRKKYTECIAKNSGTGKCSMYVGGKFCSTHSSQYDIGIIDRDGRKIRDPHAVYRNSDLFDRFFKDSCSGIYEEVYEEKI